MRHLRNLAVFIALIAAAAPAFGQSRTPKAVDGNVIEVISGDTLVVVSDGVKYKVRLMGVDAPEQGQPFFDDAIRILSEKTLSRRVHVDVKGGDRSKGYEGLLTQGDKPINRQMVAEGAAWHDPQVPSPALKAAQKAAEDQKLGLWAAAEKPESPWDYRGQQPDAKALADEKHKAREDEAAKAAADFLTAWQGGAAPDDLLTTKGKQAEEEKKKPPSALSGAEIKPGKVQIRGNSADVLLNLTKGESKLRGKVKLRSEQKKWLVMAVEIGSPPAILDFENSKSTVEKLQAALDRGFQDKEDDDAPGEEGVEAGAEGESRGGGRGKGGGAPEPAEAEPAEPEAASESEPAAEEPMPAEEAGASALAPQLPPGVAPKRRGGMGAKVKSEPAAEGEAPVESNPTDARAAVLAAEIDTTLRAFLAAWSQRNVAEMEPLVHSASGSAELDKLPPILGGLEGAAIAELKLRRLPAGETYLDAAGAEQTVAPGDASDEAALVVSDRDPLPYRLVLVEGAWKVDVDHLMSRAAPPEEPMPFRNPKFRNR